jgi:tetratricopeptide (TPR) repeat protein
VTRALRVAGLLLLSAGALGAQEPAVPAPPTASPVIDVGPVSAVSSFEALWADYKRADDANDPEASAKTFSDIRWFRTERNIRSLETVALALVARGQDQLRKGDRARAEDDFRKAISVDPYLPDAHYGLARAELKKGVMGVFSAVADVFSAVTARSGTAMGRYFLFSSGVVMAMVALLLAATTFSVVMLMRYGALLLHDIEEALGAGSRPVALGVFVVFLVVPLMTLQGYGWLPLWWMALLFLYFGAFEKGVAALFLLLALLVGPAVRGLEGYVLANQNPLLRASLLAIEGGPDTRAIADLTAAGAQTTDDQDLRYLLALQYKKAARYDDAAGIYRSIIESAPKDPMDMGIALNNLGNIEFARGEFKAAIARYRRAAALAVPNSHLATFWYNQSLAHLQLFEYDPNSAARSEADRFDRGLVQKYEGLWKADKRGSAVSAVADLMPSSDEVWAKYVDTRDGVGLKNVAGRGASPFSTLHLGESLFNRFTGFLVLFGFLLFAMKRWRGEKMFTMRCQKCGMPFCRKCHLGAAVAGLCTQCHHLFVVRDGVSGPARTQKLEEVQDEEDRRNRVFRILSFLVPGSGQMYGHMTAIGLLLSLVWFALITTLLLGGRLLPVTETPAQVAGPWTTIAAVLGMILVYVLGHRLRPDFDYEIPVAQRGPRRMAKAS